MPRLRNRLIIQGHTIGPGTIIELTNLIEGLPMHLEVLNINNQYIECRSKYAHHNEYSPTRTLSTSSIIQSFRGYMIHRVVHAQT